MATVSHWSYNPDSEELRRLREEVERARQEKREQDARAMGRWELAIPPELAEELPSTRLWKEKSDIEDYMQLKEAMKKPEPPKPIKKKLRKELLEVDYNDRQG